MELLIENLTNKEKFCKSSENPVDISEWNHVAFNDSNEIVKINGNWQGLEGPIDFQWLPLSSKIVTFGGNKLSGTVDLICLPKGLEVLDLLANAFDGTVDLTKLPPGMSKLFLNCNQFHGTADFTQLPKTLTFLNVASTQLEGEVFEFHGILGISKSKVIDKRRKGVGIRKEGNRKDIK